MISLIFFWFKSVGSKIVYNKLKAINLNDYYILPDESVNKRKNKYPV
ncbi:hypothetical protein HMPREF9446_02202 [Bacteroides fluxus YIT 12057]|uniref:Uncharacterized protein n=1 Tax=Bacteroides fluxus YIT 12057 TaxID=763034 RepID=F3PTY2_9BACE|nr:hypothetical protein HMPREF9446_02202 [Bacteroides fluxus YIT 12057]